MPHVRHLDVDSHGYSIVEVDRDELRFEWWNVDDLGPGTKGQKRAAHLAVRHGIPQIVGPDLPPTIAPELAPA
jgi:alkaline phosphatase D